MLTLFPSPEYSVLKNAAIMAALAEAAYHEKTFIRKHWRAYASRTDGVQFATRRRGAVELALLWTTSTIAISIAGTNDPDDVKSDIDLKPQPLGDVAESYDLALNDHHKLQVPSGVAACGALALKEVEDMELPQFKNIYLSGHSLGGAIAVTMPRLHAEGDRMRIFTFGQQRTEVGRLIGKRFNITRFANVFDFVPDLPPRIFRWWRQPLSDAYFIRTPKNERRTSWTRTRPIYAWPIRIGYHLLCLARAVWKRQPLSAFASTVNVHAITNYRHALELLVK